MGALLSLGSINADLLLLVDAIPGEASTIHGRELLRTSGGKAATVAVIAHRLGADVVLIGCVGRDDLAEQALRGPRSEGVALDSVRSVDAPTGTALILVPPDGNKVITLATNANDAWLEHRGAVADEVSAARPGSVLVVDVEVPVELVDDAVAAARARGVAVVLDPAPPDRVDDRLLARVDHVTPDDREAEQLTGIDVGTDEGARAAAADLCRRGAGVAYMKLAGGGCVVSWTDGTVRVDAPVEVEVVDKTGAGDAFAGALGWRLLEGDDPPTAAIAAVAAATCAVGGYGSQESYPDRPTLSAMMDRIRVR